MRLANSTGGWLLPPRTAAVTLSLPSVKDPRTSLLQNNKNNNTRQPLRPSPPVRRGKKPKPVKSESPGIFVISDSQRKELLKTPLVLHPATPVPVIPRPPTCRHHEKEAPTPPKKVISCPSIPPTRPAPPRPRSTRSVRPTGKIEEEKMSLLEQKRQQWAKEREELHGLWSPWGKTNVNALDPTNLKTSPYSQSGHIIDNNQSNSPGATVVTASYVSGLGLTTKASSSLAYPHNDVYLPPISGAEQIVPGGAGRRSTATTTTTSWAITASNNMNNQENLRKSSLPNRMQSSYSTSQSLRRESHPVGGDGQHHQHYHPNISEETPMAEWRMRRGSVGTDNFYHHPEEEHNNNNSRRYLGDTEDYNITMERGSGRSPGRVIVHKIFMERGDSGEMDERMSRSLLMEPSSLAPNAGPAGDSNMANMKEREFGGSMGYIGLGKPPAPAMRSSLTIGLDPSYARSLEIIEKQEKEKWLAELEQQREEQRVRKLMEKDEKRARWGDRGIGVGHFWEPSDSASSRLPASSPYHPHSQIQQEDEDEAMQPLSPSPPPWLERSLERMVTSKSLTNLREEGNENTGDIEPYIGGAGTTNRFVNLSSSDLRKVNDEGEGANEEKSFARGHNSLLDPDINSEMEKKRQANHEHLEALRKQMEEKRIKQEEEKQKQLKEERDHEERMKKAAELDLKRLKQEYRKQNASSSDLDDFGQTTNNHVVTTNDSMTEDADEDVPKHESPLIPHSADEGLPDAYELEIARRQSLLLTQKPSFTSTDESGGKLQGSSSMMDLRQEAKMVDQCLMTDSDHIYERTLTPTTERTERKRSASLGRSEFGTQTEQEEFSSGSGSRRGARKSRGEKVEEEKAKEEKPRWGANPVKKQYLKQSEKDPYYMQRLRKRNQRTRQGDSAGTDDSEEAHSGHNQRSTESQSQSQGSSIPFSRIRSRKLSRSPVKTPMGPLKAIHGVKKTEEMKTHQIESQLASAQRGLARNFPSDPQLHRKTGGKPPQIRGGMNGIVRQSLGSISGLNSVGGSEGSGSGYTSPSIGPRNSLGSGGSDSLRSGSVHSPAMAEYVPTFSSDFIPMREFDEIPINAGKIAPGFRKTFGMEDSITSIPSMEEYTSAGKSSSGFRKSFGKENINASEVSMERFTSAGKSSTGFRKSFGKEDSITSMPSTDGFASAAKSSSGLRHSFMQEDILSAPSMEGFTSAGKSSSGFRKSFEKETSMTSEPSMEEYASEAKSSSGFRTSFGKEDSILSAPSMEEFASATTTRTRRETSSTLTKRSATKSESRTTERNTRSRSKSSNNKYESSELEEREDFYQGDRLNSPPVPALMKKMQMGFHPDESGRLSSLPPDILSPLPPIKIGTPIPMHSKTPSISDMRISSSVPKLDIDIAVTSSSNQDLQRLLETVREQARLSRGGITTNSSEKSEDEELYEDHEEQYEEQEQEDLYGEQEDDQDEEQEEEQDEEEQDEEDSSSPREEDDLPERFKLPDILPDPFPPVEMLTSRTLESDVSFNLQEEFINTLMSQKEVQEQLTAREKELCDKGIIEFNVRLPSRWAHRKNPLRCNSTSKILDDYKDPLASERRRNTASWLRNSDDASATESILNNLAALKQLST